MARASRFRTLSNLLVLLKVTSLVCKMLRIELCSSDQCWPVGLPITILLRCLLNEWFCEAPHYYCCNSVSAFATATLSPDPPQVTDFMQLSIQCVLPTPTACQAL